MPTKLQRRSLRALIVALIIAAAAGCGPSIHERALEAADSRATTRQVENFNEDITRLAAQAAAAPGEYQVGPEDLIEVTLYDIQNETGEPRIIVSRVSNSGFMTLPYIGKVQAAGMNPLELEEHLRREYTRFIKEPQITIFIREYRSFRVSVVGNVKSPGVLELRGRKTMLEALAMSGGLAEDAGRSVRLVRTSGSEMQSVLIDLDELAATGDPRLNPSLLPGDVINVPRAGIFYVEGMVRQPGAFPLLTETTITQAIVTAGGMDINLSDRQGTVLYRKTADGQREAMPVDLAGIAAGKVPDMRVQAEDVIVVPVSGAKLIVDRITGLVRVGVNAVAF